LNASDAGPEVLGRRRVNRTVVAFYFFSGHGRGGYRHLLLGMRMAFSEHVAAGGRGEERARRAGDLPVCAMVGTR
jgi:hypothetical protein